MSRYVKERMVEEYARRLGEVADVAVVDTEGIDVSRMVAFRATLRERGMQAMRIQNRLCGRAVQEGALAGAEQLFDGPTTLVWGGSGLVDIAKTLAEQAKELKTLEIRGGFSAGEVLSQTRMQDLSELPSREALIGGLVARAVGQAGRVVRLATGAAAAVVSQIREVEKTAQADASAPDTAESSAAGAEKPTASGETDAAAGAAEGESGGAEADQAEPEQPAPDAEQPAPEAEQAGPEAEQAGETPEGEGAGQETSEET